MLNVLPFDRFGRLRGGQRNGTAKLFASALSGRITGLHQVTFADAGDAGGGLLFSEPLNTGGDVDLTSLGGGTRWLCLRSDSGDQFNFVTSDPTQIFLATTGLRCRVRSGATTSRQYAAKLQDDIGIGTNYDVSCSVVWPSDGTAADDPTNDLGIIIRADRTASTVTLATALFCFIENTSTGIGFAIRDPTGFLTSGSTTALGTLQSLGEFEFLVSVRGNTITMFVDGTQIATATSSQLSSQVGVGFFMDKEFSTPNFSSDTASGITTFEVNDPDELIEPFRTNKLLVTTKNIYIGTTASVAVVASNVLSGQKPSIASLFGRVYIVDGTNTKDVNMDAETVGDLTATAGTVPTNCRIAAAWRGRLVLAAPDSDPQNFFFSKLGVPTNWDYTETGPDAAFAGNASENGRVGDVIISLIPFTDDVMLIGGDHSLWRMTGDPAAGGSIDIVSNVIGMSGRDAWALSPDGILYFVGTGGLFRMTPGGIPEPVSLGKYNQFFQAINRKTHYVQMLWDRDNQGAYIFVTVIDTGASTHLWYDLRTDGLFPLQWPDDHGPIASMVYDGDGPTDRLLLLGGRNGFIQKLVDTARTDDGTTISSHVLLGPINIGGELNEGVITSLDCTFGELPSGAPVTHWNLNVEVRIGRSAYDVTEGTDFRKTVYNFGNITRRVQNKKVRDRGAWAVVKLTNTANDQYWSFENVVITSETRGILR